MTNTKPIFVATHPRACSTAFERVFMTRTDILETVHEPFGDAYYFGPERLGDRYEGNEHTQARKESGFEDSTYASIMQELIDGGDENKTVFIKDMAQYLVPPHKRQPKIAPSLVNLKRRAYDINLDGTNSAPNSLSSYQTNRAISAHANGVHSENGNPSVVPTELLKQFTWTFLIRHPYKSIPSYYRCTVPPLSHTTGWHTFDPAEAGYDELRRLLDYLSSENLLGTEKVCLVDADDMLDDPKGTLSAFCEVAGIPWKDEMLSWGEGESCEGFEKWKGFHEDAIKSGGLKPRVKKQSNSYADEYETWVEKYGLEAADMIKKTADANIADYEYLKQFAIKA